MLKRFLIPIMCLLVIATVPVRVYAGDNPSSPDNMEMLLKDLEDPDWRIRNAAIREITRLKDLRAVDPLVNIIVREEEMVSAKNGAIYALGEIGDPRAALALITVIKDEGSTEWLRIEAARALAKIKDPRAAKPLLMVMEKADGLLFREAAVALGRLPGTQAENTLREILRKGDETARQDAVWALGRLGAAGAAEELGAAAGEGEGYLRSEAFCALDLIGGPRAVDVLIGLLDHDDYHVRKEAAYALGDIGDPRAVGPLSEAMRHWKPQDRYPAVWALSRYGNGRVAGDMIEALSGPDPAAMKIAAGYLGEAGDEKAMEALYAVLAGGDIHMGVREKSAGAMVNKGGSAVVYLSRAAGHDDPVVRGIAAGALGRLRDPAGSDALITALGDEDPGVRMTAANALLLSPDPEVPGLLALVLRDKNPVARRFAAIVLGLRPDSVDLLVGGPLGADEDLVLAYLLGVSRLEGQKAVPVFLEALNSGRRNVRLAAADALGGRGDKRAIKPLALALHDKEPYVRLAAARSLKKMGCWDEINSAGEPSFPRSNECSNSRCHTRQRAGKFHHFPVTAGDCQGCHEKASSEHPGEEGPEFAVDQAAGRGLCARCHWEGAVVGGMMEHGPAGEGKCLSCHDPHGSSEPHLLREAADSLCLGCHGKVDEHLAQVSIEHQAMQGDKDACLTCHRAHSSDHPALLREKESDLCFRCHGSLGSSVRSSSFVHYPAGNDRCGTCHDPHGSDTVNLLKTRPLWLESRADESPLCWNCHDKRMVVKEVTRTLTDFRAGALNLHFIHVNRKKGRSCKACHDAHASDQNKHIRPDVPFGKGGWRLPIQYTKTPEGGRCVVGCHREQTYIR